MRRTSRQPRRRRRTSRNPAPPAPSRDPGMGPLGYTGTVAQSRKQARYIQKIRGWIAKTFPPGTPVKLLRDMQWVGMPVVHSGARAEVIGLYPEDSSAEQVEVRITDARGAYGQQIPGAIGEVVGVNFRDMEPLVDHWAKGPRRTSRHLIPRSQKSWMKPNIPVDRLAVPPPAKHRTIGEWDSWLSRTFQRGTPVKVTGPLWICPAGDPIYPPGGNLPLGTRAKVVGYPEFTGAGWKVPISVTDARDDHGRLHALIGMEFNADWSAIEPLVDNWAQRSSQRRRTSRQLLPRSQKSWMKPNPIPSPPSNPAHHWHWFKRTFPVGATVMWRADQTTPVGTVPAGIKAVVDRHYDPGDPDSPCPNGCAVLRFLPIIAASDIRIQNFADELERLAEEQTGDHHPFHTLESGLEVEDALDRIVWPIGDTWAVRPNRRRTSRRGR